MIINDLKEKITNFVKNNEGKIYKKDSLKIIFNGILIFLFVFIGFRLFRLTFIDYFIKNKDDLGFYGELIKSYHIYFSIFILFIIFLLKIIFSKIFEKIKLIIQNTFEIEHDKTKSTIPIILFLLLITIIVLEYILNPYEISSFLYKTFTIYIIIFLIFKILLYSYNLTFNISETYYLEIEKLNEGEIIDKQYLIKMFGNQYCLGFRNEKGILFPNPSKYFQKIENPIDKETCENLKNIYEITNNYHIENKTINFGKIDKIKVLKTFSFSPYIFFGFIVTFLIHDKIFSFLAKILVNFSKKFIF